jgi:hypothetical protein
MRPFEVKQGDLLQTPSDATSEVIYARITGAKGNRYTWRELIPIDGGLWTDGGRTSASPIDDPAYEATATVIDTFPFNSILTRSATAGGRLFFSAPAFFQDQG